jgi:hypothetical protein
MPLPLEQHVRMVLLEKNRGQRLYEAVAEGWEAFKRNQPRRGLWIRKSTTRAMVWEEVASRLAALADDDGVEVLDHSDTRSLIFDDEVLVRVKHADVQLVTQNVPTAEAVEYDDHAVDLFGRTGLQRVRLCYILDQFETKLEWVGIAAHHKGRLLWKIELETDGLADSESTLPIDAPEVDTTKLVRIKKSAEDEKKKKDREG